MMKNSNAKHSQPFPSVRQIRRTCNRELYRAIKKLKIWIPPEQIVKAEDIYFRKVVMKLAWIVENSSNRKLLADWWTENVCPEIAELWNVDAASLERAFRESFGG